MKKISIMTIALTMVTTFTMSALAADWNFYGSARISTFLTDTDNKGARDTKNFDQSLQGNSRIGARVKVSDELTGRFEYGASGGDANIRHLYGEWNFGSGKFLVGQTDTPLNWFYSNQVYGGDEGLLSYGGVWTKRKPMLRLRFGDFKIAVIEPGTDTFAIADAGTETTIPKIEASYKLRLDNAFIDLGAGYNTYSLYNPATAFENDIDSYIFAIGSGIDFDRFYLKGNLWFGQNIGPYGMGSAVDADPEFTGAGNGVVDNDAYGYILVAGAKINDMFSVETGYGYTEAELDKTNSHADAAASYYVQSTVTLAPGVFFIPELGVIDNEQDNNGDEQSEVVYYGVKWQINF